MTWPFADQLPRRRSAALDGASRLRTYRRVTTPSGERAMLTVLAPGAVFGELALLADAHLRTATGPTLNQALQRLVAEGAVVLGRGAVEILDLGLLRRRAAQG